MNGKCSKDHMVVSCSKKGKQKARSKNVVLPYEAKLGAIYEDDDLKTSLRDAFKEKKPLTNDAGVTLHVEPFQCCQMPQFLSDERFLTNLKDELLDQIFYDKNNDLYSFQQTNDLKKSSAPHVRAIREFFYNDFRDWLSEVTGIAFTSQVDLTCSRYDDTDVLLCHDDELDSRCVAFALYLVQPWTSDDGGLLDLFDMDDHRQPNNIVKSLVPCWNSIVWFEVTEGSHHQVSEVLSEGKCRLSINGWYHFAAPLPRPPRYVEPPLPRRSFVEIEEELVYEWLNPIYLEEKVQAQILEKFEEDSEIELQGFLREDKYQELVEQLKNGLVWSKRGPPNKRCYGVLSEENVPEIVRSARRFFQSEAMFLLLSNFTGLRLHRLAPKPSPDGASSSSSIPELVTFETADQDEKEKEKVSTDAADLEGPNSDPERTKRPRLCSSGDGRSAEETGEATETETACNAQCRCEVRQWKHGCYTLVHDTDTEGFESALDAVFFCSSKGWHQNYGGFTSYIAKGEDEELLSINPVENALALVYRDKDTLKFVKYVNRHMSTSQDVTEFYDFSVVYYE